MNQNFIPELKILLERIEAMKEPLKGDDPTEYFQAIGVHQGMTTLAGQIRAMMETKEKKPLTMGCPVRIIKGPYKDLKGFYQGLTATPIGAQAEILLQGMEGGTMDLPVLVLQDYIEAI